MSDRRRFLKGLTSLPLATVLANPRLAAAVSTGLREVEAKLSDGRTVKTALATPQGQAKGSILLVHEWWGLVYQRGSPQDMRISSWVANPGVDIGMG
jgi:carboxymethylenebutenolidase